MFENIDQRLIRSKRNFLNKIRGKRHRFNFDCSCGLFLVSEDDLSVYFSDLSRGIGRYHAGITEVKKKIWSSYLLDRVPLSVNDVVVDCGAHFADLWLTLREIIHPDRYYSFEPGPGEYASILKNAPLGRHFNLALFNVTGVSVMEYLPQSADSTLIPTDSGKASKIEVGTTTLDDWFKASGIPRIKLLKVEAEGAEPEVLMGSKQTLGTHIDYVAIDGFYERGSNCEETFSTQSNILYSAGFRMIGVNLGAGRALWKHVSCKD